MIEQDSISNTTARVGEKVSSSNGIIKGAQFFNYTGESDGQHVKPFGNKVYIRGQHDQVHGIGIIIANALGVDCHISDTHSFGINGENIADFFLQAVYNRDDNRLHIDEVNAANAFKETVLSDLYLVFRGLIIENEQDPEVKNNLKKMFEYASLKVEARDVFIDKMYEVCPKWEQYNELMLESVINLWMLTEVIKEKYPSIFESANIVINGGVDVTSASGTIEKLQSSVEWEDNPTNLQSDLFNPEKLRFEVFEVTSKSRKNSTPFKIEDLLKAAEINYDDDLINKINISTDFDRYRKMDKIDLDMEYYVPHAKRLDFLYAIAGIIDPKSVSEEQLLRGSHSYEVKFGMVTEGQDVPDIYKEAKKDPEVAYLVERVNDIFAQYPDFFREGTSGKSVSLEKTMNLPDVMAIKPLQELSPEQLVNEWVKSKYFLAQVFETEQNFNNVTLTTDFIADVAKRPDVECLVNRINQIEAIGIDTKNDELSKTMITKYKDLIDANEKIILAFEQIGISTSIKIEPKTIIKEREESIKLEQQSFRGIS